MIDSAGVTQFSSKLLHDADEELRLTTRPGHEDEELTVITLSKPKKEADVSLRCPEQLQSEEQRQVFATFEENARPTLQLCADLSKSLRKGIKIEDASSFGAAKGHGLAYLRNQR